MPFRKRSELVSERVYKNELRTRRYLRANSVDARLLGCGCLLGLRARAQRVNKNEPRTTRYLRADGVHDGYGVEGAEQ